MLCNVAMLWLLLTSLLLFLFCLKAFFLLIFSFWPLMRDALTMVAMMYMREQNFGTRGDMCMYARYDSYEDRYH